MSFFQDSDQRSFEFRLSLPQSIRLYVAGSNFPAENKGKELISAVKMHFLDETTDGKDPMLNPFFKALMISCPSGKFVKSQPIRDHFQSFRPYVKGEEAEKDKVENCEKILGLDAMEWFRKENLALELIQIICARLAKAHDGLVIDPFSSAIYSPGGEVLNELETAAQRTPTLKHFLSVYQSGDERLLTTTAGLAALGLPDFCFENTEADLRDNLALFCYGAAQALVEKAFELGEHIESAELVFNFNEPLTVTSEHLKTGCPQGLLGYRPGFSGTTKLPLRVVHRADGPYLVPDFPGLQSERDDFIRRMLMDIDLCSRQTFISRDDSEIESARQKAREEWPMAKELFATGAGTLLVQKRFFTPEEAHLMWVNVEKIEGSVVFGSMESTPPTGCGYTQHQSLTLNEEEILDWLIYAHDGRELGGYAHQISIRRHEH